MRPRAVAVIMVVLALFLSSCSLRDLSKEPDWTGRVCDDDVLARVGEVAVAFPDGVAPAGTKAVVSLKPSEDVTFDPALEMSDVVEVRLGDGLQPQSP